MHVRIHNLEIVCGCNQKEKVKEPPKELGYSDLPCVIVSPHHMTD
jgi:hypothetical protein